MGNFQKEASTRFVKSHTLSVRELLDKSINHTAAFIEEREGIGGGIEFRVLTRAHGECIGAIRIEPS